MEAVQTPLSVFYDEWLNTQKNLVSNWMNVQKSWTTPNGNGSSIAGSDPMKAWKDWTDMQMQMFQNLQKTMFQWPDGEKNGMPYQDFSHLQLSIINQLFETSRNFLNSMNASDKTMDFYKQFIDFQVNAVQRIVEQGRQFTQPNAMPSMQSFFPTDIFNLYEKWKSVYGNALGTMGQSMGTLWNNPNQELLRETFSSVMSSSSAYLKLFEYLMPVFKAIQQRNFNAENYQQFLDPARYKEILDRVFEFGSPQSLQEFYELLNKVTGSLNTTVQQNMQRLTETIERNASLMPSLASGDPSVMMKMYQNILENYHKSFEPYLKVPVDGKHAHVFALMTQVSEKYAQYATANSQYQYMMYKTGQQALENVMQKVAATIQDGAEFKSFNDLFRLWVETNENQFIDLFNTENFARLQADLVELSLAIKTDFQKIMEISIADYPIAPRSEIDELAKTVHELDTQVHELKKEIETLTETKTSAKKAASKVEAQ